MGLSEFDAGAKGRRPWNAGRTVGAKRALKPQQVWAVRFWLDREGRSRDRAMFDLAIDSKLRGCIVVDVSAMPRMVALSVVAKLLHDLDAIFQSTGTNVNLHVTVAESVTDDLGAARGTLSDEVTLVVGFSGELTAQGTVDVPRVWFPILGERQSDRLAAIREKVNPDEICPVLPFPARVPRRGDEILNEHRGIIFDEFQVEPRNILLACEYNPFEAYKQIFRAMDRYRRALRELGGCKAFVSPVSSKLLSVGALLACYDHRYLDLPDGNRLRVGIPYVETAVYGDPTQDSSVGAELYSMWVRGDWEI